MKAFSRPAEQNDGEQPSGKTGYVMEMNPPKSGESWLTVYECTNCGEKRVYGNDRPVDREYRPVIVCQREEVILPPRFTEMSPEWVGKLSRLKNRFV
jgi:hypothetical protein